MFSSFYIFKAAEGAIFNKGFTLKFCKRSELCLSIAEYIERASPTTFLSCSKTNSSEPSKFQYLRTDFCYFQSVQWNVNILNNNIFGLSAFCQGYDDGKSINFE